MRIRRWFGIGLVIVATGLPALTTGAHAQPSTAGRDETCVAAFEVRVDEYWALRRRLERFVAPETPFLDASGYYAARLALADLVRAARPDAREGHLFTPDVAEIFRARIAGALFASHRTAADVLRAEADDEEWPDLAPPVVHGAFDWRWSSVMWPSILVALPPLPDDIEYRFVGADLIVVDVRSNLVVDIMREALLVD